MLSPSIIIAETTVTQGGATYTVQMLKAVDEGPPFPKIILVSGTARSESSFGDLYTFDVTVENREGLQLLRKTYDLYSNEISDTACVPREIQPIFLTAELGEASRAHVKGPRTWNTEEIVIFAKFRGVNLYPYVPLASARYDKQDTELPNPGRPLLAPLCSAIRSSVADRDRCKDLLQHDKGIVTAKQCIKIYNHNISFLRTFRRPIQAFLRKEKGQFIDTDAFAIFSLHTNVADVDLSALIGIVASADASETSHFAKELVCILNKIESNWLLTEQNEMVALSLLVFSRLLHELTTLHLNLFFVYGMYEKLASKLQRPQLREKADANIQLAVETCPYHLKARLRYIAELVSKSKYCTASNQLMNLTKLIGAPHVSVSESLRKKARQLQDSTDKMLKKEQDILAARAPLMLHALASQPIKEDSETSSNE